MHIIRLVLSRRSMMTSLKSMCADLDTTVLEYFTILDAILSKQKQLDDLMKDGFLLMAKARYNMGAKSVGALQYSEEEIEALVKVDVLPEDKEIGDNNVESFQFVTVRGDVKEEELKTEDKEEGLRQRNTKKNTEHQNDASLLTNGVEDLKLNDEATEKKKIKDPISWFGILVPQALRESQRKFKAVTQVCGELASLKHQLEQLRLKYRAMLKAKEDIVNSVQI